VKPLLIAVAVFSLAGCGSNGSLSSATAPVSKADIAAVEVSLTTALNLANKCLGATPAQALVPCQSPTLRAVMIADEHKAVQAFTTLQNASADGQPAALAAVNVALQQLASETPSAATAVPAK
jgi:predicted small lipoprotein YifL